ncbi:MAG: UDP-N-acetylmuramate dehydrogenase [Eubacteriales bacterium]|nr:UDP-N-acetylmuramate dehydrogenase [Eubacteriales bacterium]
MEHISELAAALRVAAPDIEIKENEPMRRHTTFAIGGPADLFLSPKTAEELAAVLAVLRQRQIPLLLLGNGSNMLVSDEGVRGAVVCMTELDDVRAEDGGTVTAEAGALLSRIARRAQRAGLTGAEFAGGIPGSLGGAVFMNAGAYDGQMAGIVEQTDYLDGEGELRTLKGAAHGFDYRRSVFRDHPDWTVVRSVLRLQPGEPAVILDKMNDFAQRRRDKQPLNFPSAGSTFKRPAGHFAGQLIEKAGLKGTSVGAAQVSEKHAGFLINRGGATCGDMLRLIELVQQRVRAQFGVELECEVRIVR